MVGSKLHKGIPDFISKEDLASKVGILKNVMSHITDTDDNNHPRDYITMGRFRKFIEDNVFVQYD